MTHTHTQVLHFSACLNGGVDYNRLAQHIIARRVTLKHRSRAALTEATGFKSRTLADLETGERTNYDDATLARLEVALQWQTGSVQAILNGGDPIEAAPTPSAGTFDLTDPALRKVMESDLDEDDKLKLAVLLVEERRAFDSGRINRVQQLLDIIRK